MIKNKDKIRFLLYCVAALFIIYFIFDISAKASSLDEHLIPINTEFNYNKFDFSDDLQYNKTINLNEQLGGIILKISFDIIQIVFLVAFMLLLHIYELFRIHKKNE